MKKIYLILLVVAAFFTGCSSDSETDSKLLVRQINTTASDGSNHTMKYFYDGNKISYILTDGQLKTEFMYAQNTDLILLVRVWNGSQLSAITSFSYDVDNVIFEQRYSDFVNNREELITYDENADHTLTRKRYNGIDPWPSMLVSTSKINVDANGRFTKIADWDGTDWITKSEAVYATHNSPFKNINAFERIFSYIDAKNSFSSVINYDQSGNIVTTSDFETKITNAAHYPEQQTEVIKNGNGAVIGTTHTEFIYH